MGNLGRDSPPREKPTRISLHLGGLTSRHNKADDVHVNWISLQPLRAGDRIVIEVLESDAADPAVSTKSAVQTQEYLDAKRKLDIEYAGRIKGGK